MPERVHRLEAVEINQPPTKKTKTAIGVKQPRKARTVALFDSLTSCPLRHLVDPADRPNSRAAHPLLHAAASIQHLAVLPRQLCSLGLLCSVPFEHIVTLGPDDVRTLFSIEACDCIVIAARTLDNTRLMAHKQLDRGSLTSFVKSLVQSLSSSTLTNYILVGGHDDTRQLVSALVQQIDSLSEHRWTLTHRQLFGSGQLERTLAMTAASTAGNNGGFYEIDFEMIPQTVQLNFQLHSVLSTQTLSPQDRLIITNQLQHVGTEMKQT